MVSLLHTASEFFVNAVSQEKPDFDNCCIMDLIQRIYIQDLSGSTNRTKLLSHSPFKWIYIMCPKRFSWTLTLLTVYQNSLKIKMKAIQNIRHAMTSSWTSTLSWISTQSWTSDLCLTITLSWTAALNWTLFPSMFPVFLHVFQVLSCYFVSIPRYF